MTYNGMDARDTEHMKKHNLKLHQYSISQIEKISRNKKIICFGSGNNLTNIFYAMRDLHIEERVHYIVDNDSEKWGSSRLLNGRSCVIGNPERLKSENWDSHILFITMIEYHEVLKQLEDLLNGTKAVCLVSPAYRYWYDRLIDKLTLKQTIQNIIVLQGEGDTCENAKALIQEFRKQRKYAEYKVVWLSDKTNEHDSKDRSEKCLQRELPLKRHTPKEIYDYYKYINRALFLIYENRMISKVRDEQISCYMNHGIPLKATKGKIVVYKDTDYVLSPSENINDMISEQFGADKERIIICGAPRTDCLFQKEIKQQLFKFLQLHLYKKMILWAPTFRVYENYSRKDSERKFQFGIPLLEDDGDYKAVLNMLKEKNILLVIKPHIHQELSEITVYETEYVHILKQDTLEYFECNVYDLMKLSDAMITDYSSIGFDYMLLDKPLGYTIDDMEQYTIGFSVPDPFEYMPGMRMKNTKDLLNFIDSVALEQDLYIERRRKVKDKLYTYQDANNSKRLLVLLGLA